MRNINSQQDQTNDRFEFVDHLIPINFSINLNEIDGTNLGVGSLVTVHPENVNGVIRWIGMDSSGFNTMVGVELDEVADVNLNHLTDGTLHGVRFVEKCILFMFDICK